VVAIVALFTECVCLCHVCIIARFYQSVNKDPTQRPCSKYNKTGTPKDVIMRIH
jgi:hypothetical protein